MKYDAVHHTVSFNVGNRKTTNSAQKQQWKRWTISSAAFHPKSMNSSYKCCVLLVNSAMFCEQRFVYTVVIETHRCSNQKVVNNTCILVSCFYTIWTYGFLSLCPPYTTRYTMSPLEKINVCGSFIFISYWLISHVILSINWCRHN